MKVRELIERLAEAHPESEVSLEIFGYLYGVLEVDAQSDYSTEIIGTEYDDS